MKYINTKEKYTPIITETYTIPGDRPGTMGVDWRGPVHVPSSTKDQWTRTCTECGKEEVTTQKNEEKKVNITPRW